MTTDKSCGEKKQPCLAEFGSRKLQDKSQVFLQNAWDQAEWTLEQEMEALAIIDKQKVIGIPLAEQSKFSDTHAAEHWNAFYQTNQDKFFKDRHWLSVEFPGLLTAAPALALVSFPTLFLIVQSAIHRL